MKMGQWLYKETFNTLKKKKVRSKVHFSQGWRTVLSMGAWVWPHMPGTSHRLWGHSREEWNRAQAGGLSHWSPAGVCDTEPGL